MIIEQTVHDGKYLASIGHSKGSAGGEEIVLNVNEDEGDGLRVRHLGRCRTVVGRTSLDAPEALSPSSAIGSSVARQG